MILQYSVILYQQRRHDLQGARGRAQEDGIPCSIYEFVSLIYRSMKQLQTMTHGFYISVLLRVVF